MLNILNHKHTSFLCFNNIYNINIYKHFIIKHFIPIILLKTIFSYKHF